MLVGHSYGGMLARLFASEHPEETAGLVLVNARGSDATRRQLAIWPRSQAPAARRAVFERVNMVSTSPPAKRSPATYEAWATPRWQSLGDRGQPTGTARLSGTQRRDKHGHHQRERAPDQRSAGDSRCRRRARAVRAFWMHAGVSAAAEQTPARDEVQASARARSEPVPLLHSWEGSGAAGATEFHATR